MEELRDKVQEMLHPQTIEVGGVKIVEIKDKKGRVWAVPADDDNVDPREFGLRNLLEIPDPEDGFYYQYFSTERMGEFLSRGFKLVEPTDVGLPPRPSDLVASATGTPQTSHHQVGNLHLGMIPKIVEQRYRRAMKARADHAVADIKVPRHLGKAVKQVADTDVQVHSRETKVVRGQAVVMPADPGFKEYPTNDEVQPED
jgi:hypothetical protein